MFAGMLVDQYANSMFILVTVYSIMYSQYNLVLKQKTRTIACGHLKPGEVIMELEISLY